MKIMAKFLSIFLIIAMLFTLAACNTTPEEPDNGDNNGENTEGENSGGENNGENTEGENSGGENKAVYAELADKLVTGTLTQLETTKCIKFTIDMNAVMSEDFDGTNNDYTDTEIETVDVTISEINGKLAVYSIQTSTDDVDEYDNVGATLKYSVQEVIIKDGLIYEHHYSYFDTTTEDQLEYIKEVASTWYATVDESGISTIPFAEVIAEIKNALNNDALDAIKAAVTEILAATGNTDGKVDIGFDLAPTVTQFLDYLKTVQPTDTIGTVINDALANIDPELTLENIVAALLSYETKTINEVFAEIEAYTVAEGMGTLQSIWDELIASEEFAMLAEMMGMPEEALTEMAAFKISDILSVYGEYTVGDVLYTMLAAEEEPEYDDYEDYEGYSEDYTEPVMKAPEGFMMAILQEFLPYINTTFADMGIDIYELIYSICGIEITPETAARKLAFNVSAEFDTTSGAIKAFAIGTDIDVTIPTSTYGDYDETLGTYPEIKGTASAKLAFSVAIKEISVNASSIEAPSEYTWVEQDYVD